jgi:3-hydroxy-9,10-secoandrosta-1,3,5(10)-triene-9,17-dione monooxygenase
MPVLALGIVPAAIGIAESALDAYIQRLPGKVVSYTFGEQQLDMPTTHMQLAEAQTRIRAARMLAHQVAEDTEEHARKRQAMSLVDRAAARMDCAQSVRFCLEAVEKLFLSAGGSALSVRNSIQRSWRDLHAINMHGLLCYETNTEMYGRVLLGLKQNTPLI